MVQEEADLEQVRSSIHLKGLMFKWLILLLTVHACYRAMLYGMVPFYDLDDYTLLTIAATESIANYLVIAGLMIIFNPCFYTTEFQLSVIDFAEADVIL